MKYFISFLAFTAVAFAHTGHIGGGFISGFMHPIGGLDHILAMLGVGIVAAIAGKKVLFTLGAFIVAMVLAAIIGVYAGEIIGIEAGILISIAALFTMIGFANKLSSSFIIVAVAIFGGFHGYAHGAEFVSGSFAAYLTGFSLSTLIIHLAGFFAGQFYLQKSLKANKQTA